MLALWDESELNVIVEILCSNSNCVLKQKIDV